MAGFVETTVNDIDARMRELQTELDALQAARTALLGDGAARLAGRGGRRAGRSRGAARERNGGSGGTARSSRRRQGGTRADQALELVRGTPGITIPQIADAMSIEPNYLYRVLPKLADQGKVARDGQGWKVADGAGA
jgi:hypothetical protein